MTTIRDEIDIRTGLEALKALDQRLIPIIENAGHIPLRLSEPGFSGLASIVVSQMISRASADAIWSRITAMGPVTAQNYVAFAPEVIAGFGLSRAKAATLSHLAQTVADGAFDLDTVRFLDCAEATRKLTALPGIGPWTAEVYLMFCGGHPDIFPVSDVALQASVAHAFRFDDRPSPKELASLTTRWSPWRSVAARVFWAYYAQQMRRAVTPLVE